MKWLVLAIVFALFVLSVSAQQDDVKIISKQLNLNRIVRAWNSIPPNTREWNKAMERVNALLHERFNAKVLDVSDDKRRQTVAELKVAREAMLKELDAINELIDEQDY